MSTRVVVTRLLLATLAALTNSVADGSDAAVAQEAIRSRIFYTQCPSPAKSKWCGEIFSIAPDGTSNVRLTDNGLHESNLSWSPDGTELIYTSSRDFYGCRLKWGAYLSVANWDAFAPRQLTTRLPYRCDGVTDWSRDGEQVLYTRSGLLSSDVYSVSVDGSNETALTDFGRYEHPDKYAGSGHWLEDEMTIALTNTNGPADTNLYRMRSDGGRQRPIRNGLQVSPSISVAPNGQTLALTMYQPATDSAELYRMESDGTGLVQLTETPAITETTGIWSPDGSRLAVWGYENDDAHVFVIDADGSGVRQIDEDGPAGLDILAEYSRAWAPVWSPDGTQVAFLGEDFQGSASIFAVYVANADGTQSQRLTDFDTRLWLWGWVEGGD